MISATVIRSFPSSIFTIYVVCVDLAFLQHADGQILAELPMHEVRSFELFLPVTIGFDLVDEDGPLLTAVSSEISLTVSVEIQPSDPAAAAYRTLPDRIVF